MQKKYEEISFMNSNLKELLKDLKKRLTKYDGRYQTKQFREWIESLLMLETDILKDNTYNDKELEYIKRIRFVNRIINFNIYGNIRKITENENTLKWLGQPYDEDISNYKVYPKNNSGSEIPSIELDFNKKPTIKIHSGIVLEKKERHYQIDELIEELYKKKKTELMKMHSLDYHYDMVLGHDIRRLNELISRTDFTENQIKTSEHNYNLYKLLKEEYGPFEERYNLSKIPPRPKDEEIQINEHAVITGTSTVKETPVAVLKKVIEYY